MPHVNPALEPSYWEEAKQHLRRDSILARLMDDYPDSILRSHGDPFRTLVKAILGQQVSVASAQSLWNRLLALCPDDGLHPVPLLALEDEQLRLCGISRQKRLYLSHLSTFFLPSERRSIDYWNDCTDAEVMQHLTSIKGIGRWSAEMFLIFCVQRPDIFPVRDIGLQRALARYYGITAKPFDVERAELLAQSWQPYRTVALWYLWRALDPIEVQY
ncbi:MAG: DNA-3-methyladenine glycosylase 2 family protein [Alphaproteobacteria bacterium]|nr:MAG: DNA-3-methyladenine glycosylase 2 family protein [Alphaproteobacteria bacterium]TAF39326.1 MAG: DNA-3-methyladenine glycosylase 2 family protein [Alphaproteobacteria bacterium]TAF76913.1 MAG: DNA-3-methyladenine glycosylase 2 family protein [Alphaproteobacteria bacterium]